MTTATDRADRVRRWFDVAALLGVVHGAITVYWACGGERLLWTLGERILSTFEGRMWLLWPVAALKLGVALAPSLAVRRWWPLPRVLRVLFGLAGVVLVLWGGVNTIVGNLVLSGIVTPTGGHDRAAMVGHAWLWDPLFLAWGIALLLGTRVRVPREGRDRPGSGASRKEWPW